nr:transposase [Nostoc parmelioides]
MGKITRRGPPVIRADLVEAAWAMLRYNPWAAELYKRICGGQKTKKKQAISPYASIPPRVFQQLQVNYDPAWAPRPVHQMNRQWMVDIQTRKGDM